MFYRKGSQRPTREVGTIVAKTQAKFVGKSSSHVCKGYESISMNTIIIASTSASFLSYPVNSKHQNKK